MIDPLYYFVFLGLFSPGPNVVMLLASGARFGFRATWPHILGVTSGVGITAGVTGLGLAALLLQFPALNLALKILAAAWILYLAWSFYRSAQLTQTQGDACPFTYLQAVLFQWINPKVWAVAMAAAAGFSGGGGPVAEGLRLAMTFAGLNLFVCLFWTGAGHNLARFLQDPQRWRIFMTMMAVAMALSALMVFR